MFNEDKCDETQWKLQLLSVAVPSERMTGARARGPLAGRRHRAWRRQRRRIVLGQPSRSVPGLTYRTPTWTFVAAKLFVLMSRRWRRCMALGRCEGGGIPWRECCQWARCHGRSRRASGGAGSSAGQRRDGWRDASPGSLSRTGLGGGRGDGHAAATAAMAPVTVERVLHGTACERSCTLRWVLVLALTAATTTAVAVAAASFVDGVVGGGG